MSEAKKRSYQSATRNRQAAQTKERILVAAKYLFEAEGFEYVTVEKIAQKATVSVATVYALFQSKRGVLRALMDEALPTEQFQALVQKSIHPSSPKERLEISAKIARQLYDAERAQMSILRGAGVLAPEFKEFEKEREARRYHRQEMTIKAMQVESSLKKELSGVQARDILWALTGRDLYRLLVIEQNWTSDEYEQWLTQLLVNALMA